MSNAAITWAIKSGGRGVLPPGPLHVLTILADRATDHAGEDWTCFPSVESLKDDTSMSRATVERHLTALWKGGWISRVRRRRSDGKLGIYDYTLHRDADMRGTLADARNGRSEEGGELALSPTHHTSDCSMDHASNCGSAMLQIEAQPCVNLRGQEPLREPSEEPSLRARATQPGFGEAFEAYPVTGKARTDFPAARRAWGEAVAQTGPDRLVAAVRRYVADDRDLKKGDYGAPGFHHWLERERWRPWLADPGTLEPRRTEFVGPAEVRDLVAEALGADRADFLLKGGGWRAADRTLLAATSWSAGKLSEELGPRRLAALDIRVSTGAPA